ncbi:MAG: BatA domain-containing protein [Verrucomicrobiales bacterium]
MSFFAPSAAWLFLLALPLIALYFLKLKRPRVMVPSLVLWRRVLDNQRVNSPFQRFKRNLLLLL